ncbi:MAG: hypothetical protein HYY06_02565 [Deltaproteobacteria bacterium]|nr:hypothetical protein [Deltaproteobacteria bacterium]
MKALVAMVVPLLSILVSCGDDDDDGAPPEWRTVYESLEEGWLVSAWANGRDDVWFVGGTWDQALVVRWDGERFGAVDIDGDALLWWAWGSSEGDLWVVGERGSIFRGEDGAFVPVESPVEDATFYGVWGATADDLWAVGNVPIEGETPRGVIVRSEDGGPFEEVEVDGDPLPGLFKVWGSAAGDVFFVGESGTLLHWDGAELRRLDAGTTVRLFTVHGCGAGDVYAVGGFGNGVVLHQEGAGGSWTDISPPFAPLINGVHCASGGDVVVVGMQGYVATRTAEGGWAEALPTNLDLHGVWHDGGDFGFAVGGNLLSAGRDSPQRGVLAHLGQVLPGNDL